MKLALAQLLLGPVLLWQGYRVRRTAPGLPEPPGPREGSSGEGPVIRLLVLGDSAAAGVGVASQRQALLGRLVSRLHKRHAVQWRLVARTGATTAGTIRHLEEIDAFPADVVVTSLGVNDVTASVGVKVFLAQQERLYDLLRTKFGARLILASGLPPMERFPALPQPLRWYLGARAAQYDLALARSLPDSLGGEYLALAGDMDEVHMADDGFHPGPTVYDAWAEAAARRITAFLA